MLGLSVDELPRTAALGRYEMPHILLTRVQHHLKRRLGVTLNTARLYDCRTTQDILDLLEPARADAGAPGAESGGIAVQRKPKTTPAKSPSGRPTPSTKPKTRNPPKAPVPRAGKPQGKTDD